MALVKQLLFILTLAFSLVDGQAIVRQWTVSLFPHRNFSLAFRPLATSPFLNFA